MTVLVFNVTCHQMTDTKNLSGWMPQTSLQNCSALTLRILLPLSHSTLSYKTTAWWTIPHELTAFPHFPFLTRGYARAYHELLQGQGYANESFAHS